MQPISWPGPGQNTRKQSSFPNRLSGWAGTQPLYMQLGSAKFHAGRWREAVDHFERALILDPLDPMGFSIRAALAHVCIALGEDSRAIELAARAVRQNPSFAWAWRALAAVYALSGRMSDAKPAYGEMLRLDPNWKLSHVIERTPGGAVNHRRLVEGLLLLENPGA